MKEKKPPLVERICRALDVLPESVAHTPLIELHGRSLLKITNGGKILLYTNEKITVAIARSESRITVTGSALSCSYYNLGAIGIEGCIDTVSFEEDTQK